MVSKPQKNPAKSPAKRPHGKSRAATRRWNHTHLIVLIIGITTLLTGCIAVLLILFVSLRIPAISSLADYRPPLTTVILDRNGKEIDHIYRQNRFLVEFKELPNLLPKAFLAAEDARFYSHPGVDAWSVLRALFHNIAAGERSQGGSTITQQVARSLLLSPEKTYSRKVKEAILAYRIDQAFSKTDILTIYLNQIYFGEGAYGVEAASRKYFGKHAKNLSLAEIALLAGLPQAPSRYSPTKHFDRAQKRQAYVLNRMAEEGYITPTAARKAFKHKLQWAPRFKKNPDHQYFLQQVKNRLNKKYGSALLAAGGFTVRTTLDENLQQQAARAIKKGVASWQERHRRNKPSSLPQAALIAIEVNNGAIRAIMGGFDFAKSQFNRATQAKRQPGSAFKPIIYAGAFEQGLTPGSIFIDEPLVLPGATSGSIWQPENFSGKHYGDTTLRDGLIYSRNIITIKILQETGIRTVIDLAKKFGIKSSLTADLSLALGSSEVSLLELTAAYACLANQGRFIPPLFYDQITDHAGRLVEEKSPRSRRIISKESAFQVTHLLEKVIEEGTGRSARGLGLPVAGKTGTSDQNIDAWFIGYTPSLATGVWMGFDKKKTLGFRETGGRAAAPIWRDFMNRIKANLPKNDFQIPEGIRIVPMDTETGIPTESTETESISWEAFRITDLADKGEEDVAPESETTIPED